MSQIDPTFWAGKRVLVTGHTGFKGSWLLVWLHHMGAQVTGLALDPDTRPSLFDDMKLDQMCRHHVGDIRDRALVERVIRQCDPQIVLHMAAQPLVRRSYDQPIETFAANVMGTAHVLDACRKADNLRVVVSVTTDKVYENHDHDRGYVEDDPLGGSDPYSASKAAAELVTQSWRRSFLAQSDIRVATARAGNVIGGGDHAQDRIIPDAVRAFAQGRPLTVRNPQAVRPWQLVVEPLAGYLMLAQALWHDPAFADAWNFGPDPAQMVRVGQVAQMFCQAWGDGAAWTHPDGITGPKEAGLLLLDPAKARRLLQWHPRFDVAQALDHTARWYKAQLAGADAPTLRRLTLDTIALYQGV